MKNNLLLLLLLAMGLASCQKDKGTIKDASDVIGEWHLVDVEYYYDGQKIPVNVQNEHFYYLGETGWGTGSDGHYEISYSVIYDGPESFYEDGYIINEDGSAYYWDDEGIYEEDKLNWFFQTGQVVFTDKDGESDRFLSVSGNKLCEEYTDGCAGYYISDDYIENSYLLSPEDITTHWSGRDGERHELKEVYIYAKR